MKLGADLHCHTKFSDGSMAMDELIGFAKRSGLEAIAITDHDTLVGAIMAKGLSERRGIQVIPGVELSAFDGQRGKKVHILAYQFTSPEVLEPLCHKMMQERKKASLIMLQKVMRIYPITPDMVAKRAQGGTNIYRQHIMHALIDAGYADQFYGDVYERLFSPETGDAYYGIEYPDVRDVVETVHNAGGIAVLAHPAKYESNELMEELTENYHLDGVEAFYPGNRLNESVNLSAYAKQHGILSLGGTDFHGMYGRKTVHPGSNVTPPECFKDFLNYKKR